MSKGLECCWLPTRGCLIALSGAWEAEGSWSGGGKQMLLPASFFTGFSRQNNASGTFRPPWTPIRPLFSVVGRIGAIPQA